MVALIYASDELRRKEGRRLHRHISLINWMEKPLGGKECGLHQAIKCEGFKKRNLFCCLDKVSMLEHYLRHYNTSSSRYE